MKRVRYVLGRVSSWVDGYKTHIANVTTFWVTAWLWHKGTLPTPEAASLCATTALSSLFRMMTSKPGPLAPGPQETK